MADPAAPASAAEPSPSAAPSTAVAAPATPPQPPAQAVEAEAAPSPPPPAEDWRDKRIKQLSAKLKETQAQVAQQPAAPTAAAPAGVPQAGSAEFNVAVELAARQKAEVDSFNAMCNGIAADGRTRFGEKEFNDAAANLIKLVDLNDQQSVLNYNAFLMAANESGDPAQLLIALGADLNEASKVLSLSPIKMAAELTRRVVKAQAADPNAQPAALPRPISQIVGRAGNQHTPIAPSDPARQKNLSTPDWMKRREQEVEARRREKLGLPAQ